MEELSSERELDFTIKLAEILKKKVKVISVTYEFPEHHTSTQIEQHHENARVLHDIIDEFVTRIQAESVESELISNKEDTEQKTIFETATAEQKDHFERLPEDIKETLMIVAKVFDGVKE